MSFRTSSSIFPDDDARFALCQFVSSETLTLSSRRKKKRGGAVHSWITNDFLDFISLSGLMDLQFEGSPFTWIGGAPHGGRVMKRLDRCLVSPEWLGLFPNANLKHLIFCFGSLSFTLKLVKSWASSLFRFEHIWLHYRQSWSIVDAAWNSHSSGGPAAQLNKSLFRTKKALRSWSKEKVANLFSLSVSRKWNPS